MLRWLAVGCLLLSCSGATRGKAQANPTEFGQYNLRPVAGDTLMERAQSPSLDVAHQSFLRGLYLRSIGRTDFAIPFYKRALAHDPENRFLAFELAELLANSGQPSQALAVARRALSFRGELRADESYLMARLFRENNQLDSARRWYETTIERWPSHMRALYEYSVLLEITQDYKNLARIYDLMIPEMNYPKSMVERQKLLLRINRDENKLIEFLRGVYGARADADVGRELALLLANQKRYSEALEIAKELLAQDSADLDTRKLLVRLSVSLRDWPRALSWQKSICAIDTGNAQEWQKLAVMEFEAGQTDSALVRFEKLVQRTPVDHLSWFYLSHLAHLSGDTARALNAIERAIALKPDALAYRNQLAAIYYVQHKYEEAHKALDAALVLHPDQPLAMQFKAFAYIHQAVWIESSWPAKQSAEERQARDLRLQALGWLRKAYAADTMSADILFDLAANLERLDSVSQAVRLFEKLLLLEPRNHRALNYLGYTLVDRQLDVNRGAALIDSALAEHPGDPAYLDSKAWAYYRQGKYDEARQILELITGEMRESHPVYWEHLAEVYEKLRMFDKAQFCWRKVLEMNPRHAEALKRVAILNDKQ